MAFKPGQSGNPGGRSKAQAEFEVKCRAFLAKDGWDAIEAMARDHDKKIRQWALEQMMNRGFGKPKEVVDVTTRDESLLSPESIADSISQLIGPEDGAGGKDTGASGGVA